MSIRGGYNETDYSDFGKLNEKDGASILASMATYQPLILSVSAAIETRALQIEQSGELAALPGLGFATTFLGSWLIQTLIVGVLKMIACLLRDQGSSLMRDFSVWLWRWFFATAWQLLVGSIRNLLSPGWLVAKIIRPTVPTDEPDEPERPIIDKLKRLRPRRK